MRIDRETEQLLKKSEAEIRELEKQKDNLQQEAEAKDKKVMELSEENGDLKVIKQFCEGVMTKALGNFAPALSTVVVAGKEMTSIDIARQKRGGRES